MQPIRFTMAVLLRLLGQVEVSTSALSISHMADWILAKSYVQMSMAGLSMLQPCSRLTDPLLAAQ